MGSAKPPRATARTIEEVMSEQVASARSKIEQRLHEGEEWIRKEPLKAVACALVAGAVLRSVPMAAVAGLLVRAAFIAAKPAAVLYGAARAYEVWQKSHNHSDLQTPANSRYS